MKTRSMGWLVVVGAAAVVTACSTSGDGVDVNAGEGTVDLAKKPARDAQLNLSHIACEPDGSVVAHFVLLHYTGEDPGPLEGSSNQGPFSAEPYKNVGNVWHYNVYLSAGPIEIYSATAAGTSLHNPGEYSGNYYCGEETSECPIVVEDHTFCKKHGGKGGTSPGVECGWLGLEWTNGKDDGVNANEFPSTQEAYVAIVKSGSGGCEGGASHYTVYTNISVGDVLISANGQAISHVTYCACPAQ